MMGKCNCDVVGDEPHIVLHDGSKHHLWCHYAREKSKAKKCRKCGSDNRVGLGLCRNCLDKESYPQRKDKINKRRKERRESFTPEERENYNRRKREAMKRYIQTPKGRAKRREHRKCYQQKPETKEKMRKKRKAKRELEMQHRIETLMVEHNLSKEEAIEIIEIRRRMNYHSKKSLVKMYYVMVDDIGLETTKIIFEGVTGKKDYEKSVAGLVDRCQED